MYSIVFSNKNNKQKTKISKFKVFVLCDHWIIYDPKFKFLLKEKSDSTISFVKLYRKGATIGYYRSWILKSSNSPGNGAILKKTIKLAL